MLYILQGMTMVGQTVQICQNAMARLFALFGVLLLAACDVTTYATSSPSETEAVIVQPDAGQTDSRLALITLGRDQAGNAGLQFSTVDGIDLKLLPLTSENVSITFDCGRCVKKNGVTAVKVAPGPHSFKLHPVRGSGANPSAPKFVAFTAKAGRHYQINRTCVPIFCHRMTEFEVIDRLSGEIIAGNQYALVDKVTKKVPATEPKTADGQMAIVSVDISQPDWWLNTIRRVGRPQFASINGDGKGFRIRIGPPPSKKKLPPGRHNFLVRTDPHHCILWWCGERTAVEGTIAFELKAGHSYAINIKGDYLWAKDLTIGKIIEGLAPSRPQHDPR
jgi:hypothetical protein